MSFNRTRRGVSFVDWVMCFLSFDQPAVHNKICLLRADALLARGVVGALPGPRAPNLPRHSLLLPERVQESHVPLVAIAPGGCAPGPIRAQHAIAGVPPLAYALGA